MSPSGLHPTHLEVDRVISTFSFDPNLQPSPQNPIDGRPSGHLSRPPERLGHLLEGGLRRSGKPHKGFTDPITNDRLGLVSNVPISELTKRVTRAIEASDVSSTPLVAETMDGTMITKTSRPSTTPLLRAGARGKLDSQGDRTRGHRTMAQILGRGYLQKLRITFL